MFETDTEKLADMLQEFMERVRNLEARVNALENVVDTRIDRAIYEAGKVFMIPKEHMASYNWMIAQGWKVTPC